MFSWKLPALSCLVVAPSLLLGAQSKVAILDAFGRDVTKRGITLLDWDGFMANPTVKLTVTPPVDAAYPASVSASGDSSRFIFSRSSEERRGIGTRVEFAKPGEPASFLISVFPNRQRGDEKRNLLVTLRDAHQSVLATVAIPVRIVGRCRPHKPDFQIGLDFSQDRTGLFKKEVARRIAQQAADDWADFIERTDTDEVKAGTERTEIWNTDGFKSTRVVENAKPYRGMLLYFYGIAGPELRSGGYPSSIGHFQTWKGRELPLRRSGGVAVEVQGDYHKLGWFFSNEDDDWWSSGSLVDEPADFYSIMLHEIGHALGFESTYAAASAAHRAGRWSDPEVRSYLGFDPPYDRYDHFAGSVDPASGFGVFGNEYGATMKVRRWLITKAHLLLLKSVGYRIRPVSCFSVLAASYGVVPALAAGREVNVAPQASGGIPDYNWEIVSGRLPLGLSLDPFTGAITGRPGATGSFALRVRVTDQSPQPASVNLDVKLEVR